MINYVNKFFFHNDKNNFLIGRVQKNNNNKKIRKLSRQSNNRLKH